MSGITAGGNMTAGIAGRCCDTEEQWGYKCCDVSGCNVKRNLENFGDMI